MFELLRGVKVIDLTTVVLGPYATQLLGDFGADVIKVEPLEGDVFRAVRPGRSARMGAGFVNFNRNKRSVSLDLKQPEGQDALLELVRDADALVHNMRPGSAARLGASWERLSAVNPSLVYCYAPGFGQDGPLAAAPAYDDIVQAMSGIAHLNAGADGAPRFVPTIVGDKVGGLHLALAVLAGLVQRARTGGGGRIEAPMYESVVAFLMTEQLSGASFVPPLGPTGYARLQSPYRKPFRTRDGFVSILPYTSRHWIDFLRAVGEDALASEPWVADAVQRSARVDELYQVVDRIAASRTTGDWLQLLGDLDVPCARLNSPDTLLDDAHLNAVGFFPEYDHPVQGRMRMARSPFRVLDAGAGLDRPAPELGVDTLHILREAGLDDARIAALQARGVIRNAFEGETQ